MIRTPAAVLITAAGNSTRMGKGPKKEFRMLKGRSVLDTAVWAFHKTGLFTHFVITLPENVITQGIPTGVLSTFSTEVTLHTVPGGNSRQESVHKGLEYITTLSPTPKLVLVHDGARPWVTAAEIESVFKGAEEHGGCIPIRPVVNAPKRIDNTGRIVSHESRQGLVTALTPQGFLFHELLSCHRKAEGDGRDYIDDSEIFQVYAGDVYTVPGSEKNLKITFSEDLKS